MVQHFVISLQIHIQVLAIYNITVCNAGSSSSKLQQTFGFFGPTAQTTFDGRPPVSVRRGFAFDLRVSSIDHRAAAILSMQTFERVQQRFFAQRRCAARLVHRLFRHALFASVYQHLMTTALCTGKNQINK